MGSKEHAKKKKRRPTVNISVPDIRKDNFGHWRAVVEGRQRFRYPLCKLKLSVRCEKCNA